MAEGDEQANIKNYTDFEALLKKRIETWEYLQRVHAGTTHWLNVTPITTLDLADHFADSNLTQRRCEEWLCLGASLASLLPIGVGFPFVAAVHQLWDEFEAHFGYLTQAEKRSRTVKLEYLILPNFPSALDYELVFATLLDVLIATYSRFLDPSMATQMSNDVHAVFLKLDGRFRHYIYDPAMKELNQVALSVVTSQMCTLGFDRTALELSPRPSSTSSDSSLGHAAPLSPLPASSSATSFSSPLASGSPAAPLVKSKFAGIPPGRHRKEGDTHHFEELYMIDEPLDQEGWPASLHMNLDGVRVKARGSEQHYAFPQIPRYRYDDRLGFFEFEYDKPGTAVGLCRFRTNQAAKICDTVASLVDKLVKMRNAKK